MDDQSKIEYPIIVTINCLGDIERDATPNAVVIDALFGVELRTLHFSDKHLEIWWILEMSDDEDRSIARNAVLAAMDFLARRQSIVGPDWYDSVRLVVIELDYDDARLRSARDFYVSLFPNAVFHSVEDGQIGRRIWGAEIASSSISPEESISNQLIEILPLGVRVYNALKRERIETIGQLQTKTEKELLLIPKFGNRCLEEVMECLAIHRLELADA